MKKLINLIALLMLVGTNFLTPFSYAQVDTTEVIPENEVENVEEVVENPEKGNEITGESPDNLGEKEGEGSLPLVSEEVNETSPAKLGKNPEELNKENEDLLDGIKTPIADENGKDFTENQDNEQNVDNIVSVDGIDTTGKQNSENSDNETAGEEILKIQDKQEILDDNPELQKIQEVNIMDTTINPKDIVIEATATEANQTLKINKYFANAYTVDWGDGTPVQNLIEDTTHIYNEISGYTIILSLSGANRWTFNGVDKPLVPKEGTTASGVKITYMPSLTDGFGNSATNPGNYFFRGFNIEGSLVSLPNGSFDTSNILTAGINFFRAFNYKGELTSLPEGSFNISNITTVGDNFFSNFNYSGALINLPNGSFKLSTGLITVGNNFFWQFNTYGSLTSLPTGSFNTSNISGSVGNEFFRNFNFYGQLTSLPEDSFNISNISGSVGARFFYGFNCGGQLTSLPTGSFDTSNITKIGERFFSSFNSNGQLTSLPIGSFNISNISGTVGNQFFSQFNNSGALTSLPPGSFILSKGLTEVGHNFFYNFNGRGQLTSLPTGSFDPSHIISAGDDFFRQFNAYGQLTSLPENSFNISSLNTVGDYAFRYFNGYGALTSLPDGSFDTNNITTVGISFSSAFNYNGAITSLPNSFTLNSTGASKTNGYKDAFNSIGYTINKKVSDLVKGITTLTNDMDIFSDNQPGRCRVHENWLVSKADACHIIYDANGGEGTTTGGYESDATIVGVGTGITLPTRVGYSLSGWQDASGNNIEEVIFPDMDGQIIYAQWTPNEYSITFEDLSGENEKIVISGLYLSDTSSIKYPKWRKEGYTIHWDKKIPETMPAENMIIKAIWERNGSSGGGGGGGGGTTKPDTPKEGQKPADTSEQVPQNDNSASSGSNVKTPEDGTQMDSQIGEQSSSEQLEGQGNGRSNTSDNSYTNEQKEAYEFAKENGITTMATIQKADMSGKLTRIQMAKMLSQYAINVLGQTPDTSKTIKFVDVTDKRDADYDNGVTLAYQLGIMGQNMPGNKFRPNDEVSRAEFVTALSRLLYSTSDGEYKSTSRYYIHHMEKLVSEGIITKADPVMKERRGYVMIMLMRSAK